MVQVALTCQSCCCCCCCCCCYFCWCCWCCCCCVVAAALAIVVVAVAAAAAGAIDVAVVAPAVAVVVAAAVVCVVRAVAVFVVAAAAVVIVGGLETKVKTLLCNFVAICNLNFLVMNTKCLNTRRNRERCSRWKTLTRPLLFLFLEEGLSLPTYTDSSKGIEAKIEPPAENVE